MAKEKGYVYYEADCIANLINPFTDINAENPSIAGFKSQPLKVSTTTNNSKYVNDLRLIILISAERTQRHCFGCPLNPVL